MPQMPRVQTKHSCGTLSPPVCRLHNRAHGRPTRIELQKNSSRGVLRGVQPASPLLSAVPQPSRGAQPEHQARADNIKSKSESKQIPFTGPLLVFLHVKHDYSSFKFFLVLHLFKSQDNQVNFLNQ